MDEVEAWVGWLERTLAGHRTGQPATEYRRLLTKLIEGFERGVLDLRGVEIPAAILGRVVPLVLSGLRAELEALGGPIGPEAPAPEPWPYRSAREARLLARLVGALPGARMLPPYSRCEVSAVGGLLGVGFEQESDMLLVVSSSGLGVFDTHGKRVARASDVMAHESDRARGIGPIAGKSIAIMGLGSSRALSRRTPAGWQLDVLCPTSCMGLWVAPPGVVLDPPGPGCVRFADRLEDVRAAGFSPSGRVLVIAEQHTLHVFSAPTRPT